MLRLTAAGAALIAVSYGLARFALGLFVPELRASLGLSATEVGWVMAASYGGYLLALVVAGGAIDGLGSRRVAISAGVLATLGTLGVAAASSMSMLAVSAGLGGSSTGLASASLAAAVQTQIAPHRRGVVQTAINAATSLGLLTAAPVAVVAGSAWRGPWVGFAVLAALATLSVAATVEPTREARARRPRAGRVVLRLWGDVGPVVPSRTLGVAAVLLGLSSATFWAFGREVLEVLVGLEAAAARLVWAAVGLGGLAGALTGAGTERWGMRAMLRLAWLASATGHVALALGGPGIGLAWFATALVGAGYMALTGLLIVWSLAARPERPGAAVAGVFLLLAVGQAVGSPLMGAVVDAVGVAAAVGTAALFATMGVFVQPQPVRRRIVLADRAKGDEAPEAFASAAAMNKEEDDDAVDADTDLRGCRGGGALGRPR